MMGRITCIVGLFLISSLRDFVISDNPTIADKHRRVGNKRRYTSSIGGSQHNDIKNKRRYTNSIGGSQHNDFKKEDGEFCESANECVINDCRGNRCGGRAEGQWCRQDDWCSDRNCYRGACHKEDAYKDIGETCAHRRECLSTRCAEGKCVGRTNGEWCKVKQWCASNHCYKSKCAQKPDDPCDTLDATAGNCLGQCAWSNGKCSYSETHVWCGGHQAPSCDLCPSGNGASWCDGNCAWSNGSCMLISDLPDPCITNDEVNTCTGDCAWSNGTCAFSETHVNCGEHQAPSCSQCPSGHGEGWCNGECQWSNGNCISSLTCFPEIKPLIRDNIIGTIDNPPRTDFSISFVIKPYSIHYHDSWTSILRFTNSQSNCCGYGDRAPGLFMNPGTLQILVTQGSTKNGNHWFNTGNTQLNKDQRNTVKLEYEGDKVSLIMNDVSAGSMMIPINDRPQLNQWVIYASDNHHDAADADIEELCVKLSQSSSTSVLASLPAIKPLIKDNIIGTIPIPPRTDFAISFVIKPFSTSVDWTSILRFTDRQNQENNYLYGDRSPALFMVKGSLHIRVSQSSTKYSNHRFKSYIPLKKNQENTVYLEYVLNKVTLYMNGINAGSMSIPINDRPQLNQWVIYASDKHYEAADADIEGLTVKLLP